MTTTAAAPLDLAAIRERIDTALTAFLADKALLGDRDGLPTEVVDTVRAFVFAGGKRIRPLLCVLGWHAAGGGPQLPESVLRAAASLELFHAAVLIHDDIVDNSATRRDQPTVHRALADLHANRDDADGFGRSAAIVVGDLGVVWSDELLHSATLRPDRLAAAGAVVAAMRTEVNYGQYLDLLTTGDATADLDRALEIIRYKTVAYTCERPLQLGAVLAGGDRAAIDALRAYARPLGEAFQLHDDLLGVWGDPASTGKSNLEDLREGKHTALVALALRHGDPCGAAHLRTLLGNPTLGEDDAVTCRGLLAPARDKVERMITDRLHQALSALETAALAPVAATALRDVAHRLTGRDVGGPTGSR